MAHKKRHHAKRRHVRGAVGRSHRRSHRHKHSLLGAVGLPPNALEKVGGITAGAVVARFLDKPIDGIVAHMGPAAIGKGRLIAGALKIVAGLLAPGMLAKGNDLANYAGDGMIAVGGMELAEGMNLFGTPKSVNGPEFEIDGVGDYDYYPQQQLAGPMDYYSTMNGPDQGGLGDPYSAGGIYGPTQGGLGEVYDGGLGSPEDYYNNF